MMRRIFTVSLLAFPCLAWADALDDERREYAQMLERAYQLQKWKASFDDLDRQIQEYVFHGCYEDIAIENWEISGYNPEVELGADEAAALNLSVEILKQWLRDSAGVNEIELHEMIRTAITRDPLPDDEMLWVWAEARRACREMIRKLVKVTNALNQ